MNSLRSQAEKTFTSLTSTSPASGMVRDRLSLCIRETLEKVSQLQQVKLFGQLPGQGPCSGYQLKALLREAAWPIFICCL